VPSLAQDLYARWRQSVRPPQSFADGGEAVPERWLQQIWRHQRIRRDDLATTDGRRVQVIHPGFWNRGAGPDFQYAIIRIGDAPPVTGSIEIDVVPTGWRHHGHDRNPAFGGVVLHVVWSGDPITGSPPALRLENVLEAPLATLGCWLDEEAPDLFPDSTAGKCAAPLRDLQTPAVVELLRQASLARLARKSSEFALRAKSCGWERALWSGVFTALGYRLNVWPMRRIAEALAIDGVAGDADAVVWEARLLGVAGMLETGVSPSARLAPHVRTLWDAWWRERDRLLGEILPAAAWMLTAIRPANHPQRRLALAARWISKGRLIPALESWIAADLSPPASCERLFHDIAPADDSFWSRHWTLRSPENKRAGPLLGMSRFTDLAMNVFLPWLHARATSGTETRLAARIEARYAAWPEGDDNSVLKLARQRLFGPAAKTVPRTAAAQQGLLQIARDFCARSDAICTACRFPALVGSLKQSTTD
jgi:hypothetical protein